MAKLPTKNVANAKAPAVQPKAGNLSSAQAAKISSKANKILNGGQ